MTSKELEILIGDLVRNVEKLGKEVEKLTHHSVRQFDLLHEDNEKLAIASQQEFEGIQIELKAMEGKIETVLQKVDNIDLHLSANVSRSEEDHADLRNWVGQVDNRVKFLEKLKPAE